MKPEGPYRNQWCKNDHYLISTVRNDMIVYAVVLNGQQASESTLIFPSTREARQYLKDNGFTKTLTVKESNNG